MNCSDTTKLLHGFLDQELDPVRSLEIQEHIKQCETCSQRLREQQTLRHVVSGRAAYFEAPLELSSRVRMAVRQSAKPRPVPAPVSRSWDWRLILGRYLAPVAIVALAMVLMVPLISSTGSTNRLATEVVSAHVRSLQANHLTDVTSTDQHTVKPWFNGKVTFSPPVADFAAQGFPLIGGRLDVLDAQPVTALVYQRRRHLINLFIWPSTSRAAAPEKHLAQNGYNLAHWTHGGWTCWAVSDVSQGDLQEFAQLARAQDP